VLPDSSILAYYVVKRLTRLIEGLEVDGPRMLHNLESSFGVVFSQPVLLALVDSGLSRDDAYRIVQETTALAWNSRTSFRDVLAADARVQLSAAQLDHAFDLERSVRHAQRTIDAALAITKA
jgi:adenylosuccinate lyase